MGGSGAGEHEIAKKVADNRVATIPVDGKRSGTVGS